jgi:6-phosphogluconolactonase (cycloisomerase 2 family)
MKKVLLFALLILVFIANTTKMRTVKNALFFVGTYTKAADIHVSADGEFLDASNRGHNSIAIFKVDYFQGII